MTEFPAPGVAADPIDLGPPTAEDYAAAGETDDFGDGLDGKDIAAPPSGLDDVMARMRAAPATAETRPWEIRTRPGFAVRYSIDVDPEHVRRAALNAAPPAARRRNGGPRADEINETQMLCVILGRYNTQILADGEPMLDSDGKPLTFRSDEIRGLYGMRSAAETVRSFYGPPGEGVLLSHGRALLRESGVASDDPTVAEMDPTDAI